MPVLHTHTSGQYGLAHAEHNQHTLEGVRSLPTLLRDRGYRTGIIGKEHGKQWYLWLWSFREMTRDRPAIVLVDDHDVYHGNVWGNGGRSAPDGDPNRGGYRCSGEFINVVQRTQCGRNPDPFDPAPVAQQIGVYYGPFRYGGVDFAVVEDRKFKTAPCCSSRVRRRARAGSGGFSRRRRSPTSSERPTPATSSMHSATSCTCWPWDVDPTSRGAQQFEGWPVRAPFRY